MDHCVGRDYAGLSLACGHLRKRRWRNGRLLHSVFALNPIYAIFAGVQASRDVKRFWALPMITAVLFLAGTWLHFDMGEPAFLLYALIYLLLGAAAMLISAFIRKILEKH